MPQMRPEGTKKMAAKPQPSRKYPVNSATGVKLIWNHTDSVRVLAARMGPSAVAKMAVTESTKVIRSRCHSGQFRGSLGSSDGWGI